MPSVRLSAVAELILSVSVPTRLSSKLSRNALSRPAATTATRGRRLLTSLKCSAMVTISILLASERGARTSPRSFRATVLLPVPLLLPLKLRMLREPRLPLPLLPPTLAPRTPSSMVPLPWLPSPLPQPCKKKLHVERRRRVQLYDFERFLFILFLSNHELGEIRIARASSHDSLFSFSLSFFLQAWCIY